MQEQAFQIRGMQRDLAKSKFKPDYAYEIYNMRITPTKEGTLFSLVNEKGTKQITSYVDENMQMQPAEFSSPVLGSTVINNQLIVFMLDGIYKFWYDENKTFRGQQLFKNTDNTLNLDVNHPIECVVSYENEDIQKVYWVDGKNQTRVINVASTDRSKWDGQYFDFQPTLSLGETVEVVRNSTDGLFPGGALQYCFTYSCKNGQESKIAWISSVYYTTHEDRAVAPNETTTSSYTINISGDIDTRFDYINIYSILRTDYNSTPIVKLITKLSIPESPTTLSFVDTNLYGSNIDPMFLYYVGGENFTVNALEVKDNTLFVGDIKLKEQDLPTLNLTLSNLTFYQTLETTPIKNGAVNARENLLNTTKHVSYLKEGNTYRVGYQFQDNNGQWTDPYYWEDIKPLGRPKLYYHIEDIEQGRLITKMGIPQTELIAQNSELKQIKDLGFIKIRPVIVYPNVSERGVIAQGIVAPTVFTPQKRVNNNPFAQPSWFFRPYNDYNTCLPRTTFEGGQSLEYRHLHRLADNKSYTGECQFMQPLTEADMSLTYATRNYNSKNISKIKQSEDFYIDQSIITFHSPDLEELTEDLLEDAYLKIVGFFFIDSNYGTAQIDATTGNMINQPSLINHFGETLSNTSNYRFTYSVSTFWKDKLTQQEEVQSEIRNMYLFFPVYPWQRNGSLNITYLTDEPTAILNKKTISNFRQSQYFVYRDSTDIDDPNPSTKAIWDSSESSSGFSSIKLCREENEGLYELKTQTMNYHDELNYSHLTYRNHINQIIAVSHKSPFAEEKGGLLKTAIDEQKYSYEINLPTEIKYYSPTHAVLSFKNDYNTDFQQILPTPLISNVPAEYDEEVLLGRVATSYPIYSPSSPRIPFYLKSPELPAGTPPLLNQPLIDLNTFNEFGSVQNKTEESKKEIMWIVELHRNLPETVFGGTEPYALEQNVWVPAGEAVDLPSTTEGQTAMRITEGDTFFNRWDCIKTLPYDTESINGVVEIMSFMCESYKNLGGRYDKYSKLKDYTFVNRGTNINVFNRTYDNKNTLFSYNIPITPRLKSYPNCIAYSLPKVYGSDIDMWTQMTLASILELDGDKGKVTSIKRLDNDLIAFQELGISQILYNEQVQIQSTKGVPIELANSGKVQGKRYMSGNVGCQNKWSIVTGANGIYFIDDVHKGIYVFTPNGLIELSKELGFLSWIKHESQNIIPWCFNNKEDTFIAFYDKTNKDVFFIKGDKCLVYSEELGGFSSFMSYKGETFNNLLDKGLWFNFEEDKTCMWEHQGGDYNTFYGKCYPYGVTIIANQYPNLDKTFNTVEFRADSWDKDGNLLMDTFNHLGVETEYQKGYSKLSTIGYRLDGKLYKYAEEITTDDIQNPKQSQKKQDVLFKTVEPLNPQFFVWSGINFKEVTSRVTSVAINNPSALKRKFRIWRAEIPRDNYGVNAHPRDRIRNTWATISLSKGGTFMPFESKDEYDHTEKTILHDIVIKYTN